MPALDDTFDDTGDDTGGDTVHDTPPADRRAMIERITVVGAAAAAVHARVLAGHDRSWGTDVFALAGGQAVLCGPGLYVNRALAVGLTQPIDAADLELLEERSAVVGVDAAVDVVPTADDSVLRLTAARGYTLQRFITTHVLPLDAGQTVERGAADPAITVRRADGDLLAKWQGVAARGFGVVAGDARRASDAFARAAALVDGAGFLLATDARDGRPLGCASVTIAGGLAALGGMTTLPDERNRGVQRALIGHRLRLAVEADCDLAVSTTVPSNASERNLSRAGFRPLFETATVSRPNDR